MKRIYLLIIVLITASVMLSCSKNDPVIFDNSFVYIADESGNVSSSIDWDSQNYLATYYVYLVSPQLGADLNVSYELVLGNGLQAGVDFKHISSTGSPLMFMSGIYKMPIRIEWLKHELDSTKDNTLKIRLLSCSNDAVTIGKPGPGKVGSVYTITKK